MSAAVEDAVEVADAVAFDESVDVADAVVFDEMEDVAGELNAPGMMDSCGARLVSNGMRLLKETPTGTGVVSGVTSGRFVGGAGG